MAGAAAAPAALRVAQAQDYPSRPIRLLVGFPPGGATDIIARICAQGLSERLGKPVVVENRPGSGGNLAGDAAARAAPDGYTLLHGNDSMFTSNPHVYTKMPYDPLKELMPIASLASSQQVLAVHPSVPAQNLREFVELSRRSKPPLLYASIGNGSTHHLAMEMFKQHVGIDLIHVPYRGGGPAAIALLAGEVAAMFGGGSIVPTVRSGQFRGLASTGTVRNPATPDLPTISEIYPGYEVLVWHALFAPVGVPPSIVQRLRSEIADVMMQPLCGKRLFDTGSGDPYVVTPEALIERIRDDYDKYGKIIRAIDIKVD
jgi:tripartite-type tricarboxylate transporter receptor subunit TctC